MVQCIFGGIYRSDMRKQGIGENTGTGDRSATDIFVGYRRGYYG